MANEFNNYFTNIAQSLAGKIPTTAIPFNSYLQKPSLTSMGLLSTSPEEILEIDRDIRLTHSKGIDSVTNYRPISILPYFSKFFEKILYARLYNYINNLNVI